ncbi:MAG: hypothetical protein P1U89_19125 [Verrucomicrobiales bacterium]|nr:hypothetical protein [Verrucomicrobiales bacterium]
MKAGIFAICLWMAGLPGIAGESDPPPNLTLLYGPMARAIWKSYHIEGEFDINLFISDHLRLGSIHDGDCETYLSWVLIQIEEDPAPVLEVFLDSGDPKKVGFALYLVWYLEDLRFYDRIANLCRSPMKLPASWNFTSVSEFAELIKESMDDSPDENKGEEPAALTGVAKRINSHQADWYKKARQNKPGEK